MTEEEKGEGQKPEIKVDHGWKKAVAEEKAALKEKETGRKPQGAEAAEARSFPGPSIEVLMAGLYTQTLMALGEVENPVSGKKEKSPEEATYLIDTIAMLQEKTKGNLTAGEEKSVQNILTDLRMRYVNAVGTAQEVKETPPDASSS